MFELPEFINLARQFNETLQGKVVHAGSLGNSPHKFVWYNCKPEEFAALVAGKTVGRSYARGKFVFTPLEPGYVLLMGECGGKVLYHASGAPLPEKYHLRLAFEDGGHLTATTQMWGMYDLFEKGRELERQYVKGMRTTPVEAEFDFRYFSALVDSCSGEKRSVKGLLTADQLIPGLGNAIAQDIMFRARLHPRHLLADLDAEQRRRLFDAILSTVGEAIQKGGRNDEVDLYGRPGGYVRIMGSKAAGKPCAVCGTTVERIQYLGGACYYCPNCQE